MTIPPLSTYPNGMEVRTHYMVMGCVAVETSSYAFKNRFYSVRTLCAMGAPDRPPVVSAR